MVELPRLEDNVHELIYKLYEVTKKDWRREHLGASIIGRQCPREIWYMFRWAYHHPFDGRMLRLFGRGDMEEKRIIKELMRLKMHGVYDDIIVYAKNPDTKRQFLVQYMGGHFGGSCDGIIIGIPSAPKTPHLLEIKTVNEAGHKKLVKEGVKIAKPEHYAQMQVYMNGLKLKRALYLSVCKNDDRFYEERVHYNARDAENVLHKAEVIVRAEKPPERIKDDSSFWPCKMCSFRRECFGDEKIAPEINCRTCAHVTPLDDGSWRCDVTTKSLSLPAQKKACEHHVYNPSLMEPGYGRAIWSRPSDPRAILIEYEDGTVNGRGQMSSSDIKDRDNP